jgi:diguanylate cyclase (GGDEF)-like protein
MATSVLTPAASENDPCASGNLRQTYLVAGAFALCMALQALGYLTLGTGHAGMGLSESIIIFEHLLAIACTVAAVRRARGVATLFWLLFLTMSIVLMIPNAIQALSTILGRGLVPDRTWRALYTLYGAPVLMMAILPDADRGSQAHSETSLDLIQIGLIVGLVFSIFFYLPLQEMLPADAFEHNLTISNLVSLVLLIAVLIRLRFAGISEARDRLLRLGLFLLACAVVTFIGNWIDQHHYVAASAWWDLGWDLPIVIAGLATAHWHPSSRPEATPESISFAGFLSKNLGLIVVLASMHVIMDHSKQAHGSLLTNAAVLAVLLAFTLRLALTQYHQQQEIIQRKEAQSLVTAANKKISLLLEDARRRTDEITQINEMGSLLEACSSPAEACALISERLRRLFPSASGSLALLNQSGNRVESVAEWGANPPADQVFAPSECWALRRGCAHSFLGGSSALRCCHLQGWGPSICIPLVANGTAMGTLAIQDQEASLSVVEEGRSVAKGDAIAHRRDLVVAVGEHVALALANLNLREALRVQAVRDPLTGLYNRRYMQDFLDREAQRARRKNRPLSLMALDLDHFKLFNDTYGHDAGDHALSLVGEVLLHSVRSDDFACRYGGEEFVLILPECTLQQALGRADEIRIRLQQRPLEYHGVVQKSITVSIGVAALDETTDRIDRLLACADEALYQAKREGRDRVVAARSVAGVNPCPEDLPIFGSS